MGGDLDRMLGGVAVVDAKEDLTSARRMVNTVILLKTFVGRLPSLVEALEKLLPAAAAAAGAGAGGADEEDDEDGSGSNTDALLRALIAAFSPPCFAELRARIDEVIAESTVHERSARTRRLQVRMNGYVCVCRWSLKRALLILYVSPSLPLSLSLSPCTTTGVLRRQRRHRRPPRRGAQDIPAGE